MLSIIAICLLSSNSPFIIQSQYFSLLPPYYIRYFCRNYLNGQFSLLFVIPLVVTMSTSCFKIPKGRCKTVKFHTCPLAVYLFFKYAIGEGLSAIFNSYIKRSVHGNSKISSKSINSFILSPSISGNSLLIDNLHYLVQYLSFQTDYNEATASILLIL